MRVLAVALFVLACSKDREPNEGKRMPKAPPPPNAVIPGDFHIPVTIDGAEAPAIDADRLEAAKPTYEDHGKRAWRLDELIGPPAAREGAVMAVTGEMGIVIVLKAPRAPGDQVPVLYANLRGDVVAAMVEAEQPFPAYHGQGGRLGRPGDPMPHIAGITRIDVSLAKP